MSEAQNTTAAEPQHVLQPATPPAGSPVAPEPTAAPQPAAAPPSPALANRQRDGMTDERLASARAAWVGAGLDAKVFDAEYATGVAVPASVVATPTAVAEVAPVTADDRSEAQVAWDQEHMLDAPRSPSDYRLDVRALGMLGRPITEVVEAQSTWGAFLAGAQVNPAVGVGLVEHMAEQGRAYAEMGEADRGLWVLGQEADLLRHCGSEEAVKALRQDAGFAISWAWDHSSNQTAVAKVVEAMGQSGASKDAFVLRMLASVGRNLREWAEGRPH